MYVFFSIKLKNNFPGTSPISGNRFYKFLNHFFSLYSITGFHLSGIVWTYPPSSIDYGNHHSNNNSSYGGQIGNGNNLIGQQQPTVRMSSTERDTANNGGVNYPIEENKKYKVSVSFDR